MIGLFKAVRDYDPGRDASVATLADLCISRQMYTAIQAAQRQKHQPLNTYISLDAERSFAETEEGSGGMLFDILAESHEMTPEERVLDQERVKFLQDAIETHLSEFEKQVLDLYMTGMATAQIARVLGRDEKATGNALGRAKQKIKERIRKQA
jgi:RNA polymerase sporulation-specific sigma factor